MKKVLTKTIIGVVLSLLLTHTSSATNFLIIESQSYHPYHKMDEVWENKITSLGHQATIANQATLNDISNLSSVDVLFISSALIGLPANRVATIEQFIKNGGHVYIQSEYLLNHPGTKTFETLVNNLGGNFSWDGSSNGGLIPMEVLAPIDGLVGQVNDLNYFWFGTYGSGDETIFPYLSLNGLDYGFVFSSTNPAYGKIVTNSDQDWVRENHNQDLLENIIGVFTYELPEISITSDMDNPCPNSSISFQLSSSEDLSALDIEWLLNGDVVAGATEALFETNAWLNGDQVIAKITANYFNDIMVKYSSPIDITTVAALSTVDLQITGPQNSVCENETISFTADVAASDISNLSYAWLVNGSIVAGATTATFSPNNFSDNDIISCVLTYDDACQTGATASSNEWTLSVDAAVDVSLTIQTANLSVCEGTTVEFSSTGTNLGDDPVYQWQLNGTPVGTNSPVYSAVNLTEDALVSCTVISSLSCANNIPVEAQAVSVEVQAFVQPTIAIIPSVWTACEGQEVLFTAVGSDMGISPSFQWLVDGNPVGTDAAELMLDNLQDGQSVSCVLSVGETCVLANQIESDPVEMQINTSLNPQVNIIADVMSICEGETVSFTASSVNDGGNPNYIWLVDNVIVAEQQSVFTTANLAPNQTVVCSLAVNSLCVNQSTIYSNPVEVDVTPQATASLVLEINKDVFCFGEEVTVNAIGDNLGDNPVYQWIINDNPMNSYSSTLTIDQLTETSTITCTVVSDVACVTNSVVEALAVTAELSSLVVNVVDLGRTYCDNAEGFIEVVAEGGQAPYDYKWNVAKTGNTLEGLAAGTYHVTVTDGNGCEISSSIAVENLAAPVIEEVITTPVACNGVYGSARVFVVDFLEDYEYSWINEFGVEVGDKPDVFGLSAGAYEVIISSAPGCSIRETVIIESEVSLELAVEEMVEIKLGEEEKLAVFSADPSALQYSWSPATALSCTDCATPMASPVETTTYTVEVSNAEGCVQRLEITVVVNTEKELYIPNAFSPNNDGINDFFMIYGGNKVERIKSFQVFNRWGATVYRAANFMPNDEQYAWDGKAKNKLLGRDVFVYVIEVEFIDGKTEVFKGDVTIVD